MVNFEDMFLNTTIPKLIIVLEMAAKANKLKFFFKGFSYSYL